jgi:hypothetical protein
MKIKKKQPEKDALVRKIETMYRNYGLDTSNMSEDEFDRIKRSYQETGKSIDVDIKASEKFKKRFSEDIM